MKTAIFYLSGTGNNYIVAKKLSQKLRGETKVCSISKYVDQQQIELAVDQIGLVFPVYFADLPQLVAEFIQKISYKNTPYLFAIATCNGVPGKTLSSLKRQLDKKSMPLHLATTLDMPGNAMPTSKDAIEQRLDQMPNKILQIAAQINAQIIELSSTKKSRQANIQAAMIGCMGKHFVVNPKHFTVQEQCNGCGLCTKVCPIQHLQLDRHSPVWGEQCIRCLACFHWCPRQAIRIGGMLSDRSRYHHPEVKVVDLIGS